MADINFNGGKASNMADAKFEQDGINLRTLRRYTSILSANTISTVVSGITSGANISISGTSSAITISVNPNIVTTSINAGTILSAGTDLYSIFLTTADGNDITRVQPGLNTYTGGTANNPTINISAATLSFLSATTISAGTYYGDGSNLSGISTDNFYTTGATLVGNTAFFNRNDQLSAYTLSFSALNVGQYWTSGSTGLNSIKAINSTSLDAKGNYAVAFGNATSAISESSFAIGVNSIASASETVTVNTATPITIYSSCTITLSDPNNSTSAIVFSGDVSTEWSEYYYSYCSTFTLYGGMGSDVNVDCSTLIDLYYDFGTDSTYIVDSSIIDNTFLNISGDTFYNVVSYSVNSKPAFSMGTNVKAYGINSHAEGNTTIASGITSHAEGDNTQASGNYSHAEGGFTIASGTYSHVEGGYNIASGEASHAEGAQTRAIGDYSHAEGASTFTIGNYAHSEGRSTSGSGYASHAEGDTTIASGNWSHVEGELSKSLGQWSHAGGRLTIASGDTSFVHGSASTANAFGTIVLGNGITGSSLNTTYVNKLNIKDVPTGTTINNLGIDSNGNVIIGSTSYDTYSTGGTYSAGTLSIINNTGGTFSVTGLTINKFSYTDASNGITSVSNSNTLSKSVLIPANTLTKGALNIKGRSVKTGTSSFAWLVIYVNTANNLSGASEIGRINNGGNNTILHFSIDRTIPIKVGSFTAFIINAITGYEETITNNVSTVTIDWTVDQYIILAVQANGGASPSESLVANFLSVNQF